MKLVLLSGGSGKRLWPLSNESRSKQFLKVLQNDNGEMESMVQRVWHQLDSVGLANSAVVATSKSQLDLIQSQLNSKVSVIVEPERRDTFPAIALASVYLYCIEGVSKDEVVVILPVDPYVDEQFFYKLKELEDVLLNSDADLALIGVTPTYASEKYGYIVPEKQKETYQYVSHFREKPTQLQAQKLIEEQALWNCGVFAFKLGSILSILDQKKLPIDYRVLLEQYENLPKISFDYEVVEKTKNIVVLRYDGYWKDLGTWNTLTEEMRTRSIGNTILCEDSSNTHVINELQIPITVLGLSNIVVAASPDGILVTDKAASPRIKEVVAELDQRPMYEERRWGWYKVLDYTKIPKGNEILTKKIGVLAGKNLSYQMHYKRSEVWTIVSGEGEFALNDVIYHVQAGDVLQIPLGAKHSIKAITDLEFIEVQMGSELVEEDIFRIYVTWEEIKSQATAQALREIAADKER